MGVYITGLEMPPKGKAVAVIICSNGTVVHCREKVGTAVPVPPHGRLGDLDAAEKTIRPWTPEDEISGCTFDTVKKLMHTLLNNAPTIIPADPAIEGAQR